MNMNAMTEPTARFTYLASCGLSTFAAAASIMLGMRQAQLPAALFLALAIAGLWVTWMAYRRYVTLRNARWRRELSSTENELHQVLNHKRMDIIIEHITGPLAQVSVPGDSSEEEQPVART
jgi:hypothetical protein